MKQGLRQSMAWLHAWAGLLLGWLLYAIFMTGSVSYFQEEITRWMSPEISATEIDRGTAVASAVDWLRKTSPDATEWTILLPSKRAAGVQLYWQNGPAAPADARTQARLDATGHEIAARDTAGGFFLYRFHYDLHYIDVITARWLVGIAAMAMLVAILSGIVTHKKIITDFFLLRIGKGQRSWLDAHNVASVLFLPFILMITYTGLVSLATLYMPWGIAANYADEARFFDATFPYPSPPARSGDTVPLAPIKPLVAAAEGRWGGAVGGVRVLNPGDATARIIVSSAIDSGMSVRASQITFDGVSGRPLTSREPDGAAAKTESVLVGLHAGRYAWTELRWLYFASGIAGCIMVATGLILWTVKRRARLPDPTRPHFGFRLVEILNAGTITGLPLGIACYFLANRLLPLDLAGRADWEIHSLFIAWGAALVWAIARPSQRAWIELTATATILFAAVPLVSALTTDRNLIRSIASGDGVFAGFDLVMLLVAAGFAVATRKAVAKSASPTKSVRRRAQVAAA